MSQPQEEQYVKMSSLQEAVDEAFKFWNTVDPRVKEEKSVKKKLVYMKDIVHSFQRTSQSLDQLMDDFQDCLEEIYDK